MTASLAQIAWDALAAQRAQTAQAKAALQDFGTGVEYPIPPLATAFHPFQKGEIDILAAFTGSGKSTAVRSFCFDWIGQQTQVVYGGFEMGVQKTRLAFAAAAAGLDCGPVLSGKWEEWPDYLHQRKIVDQCLTDMDDPQSPWANLHIATHRTVTPESVTEMGNLALALDQHATHGTVIIVDHIDQLDPSIAPYEASRAVCGAILHHANTYGTRWLCTSQLNRSGNTGGDSFWRHRPVQEQMILHGSTKGQIATRVYGVYRPLNPDATMEQIKAVREGRADMQTVLSSNLTAFNIIKHRWTGSAGTRILVGYEKGRLIDLPFADKVHQEQKANAIRTSFGYD